MTVRGICQNPLLLLSVQVSRQFWEGGLPLSGHVVEGLQVHTNVNGTWFLGNRNHSHTPWCRLVHLCPSLPFWQVPHWLWHTAAVEHVEVWRERMALHLALAWSRTASWDYLAPWRLGGISPVYQSMCWWLSQPWWQGSELWWLADPEGWSPAQ